MGQVGQQNQRFLSGQTFLASPFQSQSTFIGLDFCFASAAVIIAGHNIGHRQTGQGRYEVGMFDFARENKVS